MYNTKRYTNMNGTKYAHELQKKNLRSEWEHLNNMSRTSSGVTGVHKY